MITVGGVTFDLKLTFLIVICTILPMVDFYNYRLTELKAYDRFILYFIIPMLIILLLFRESPAEYGFTLGNWRVGLMWTAVGCVGMAIILWFASQAPTMEQYYVARAPQETWRIIYLNGVDLFGWEFIWRGLLLFAFARAFGPGPAIFLQAVPFAFMHLGKPPLETFSTIFGGAAFGFVAWQSGSFVYPWLIHWFIACYTMLLVVSRAG
jgi:uncharacterized protein